MLIERRGHVRTVTVKMASSSQESESRESRARALELLTLRLSTLDSRPPILQQSHGDVAELADALDLGSSSRKGVQVQLLSSPVEQRRERGVESRELNLRSRLLAFALDFFRARSSVGRATDF